MLVKKLPTIRISDALRRLGVGPVRGYSANEAEIKASGQKAGVMVGVDTKKGVFDAVLLNEWDDSACMYMSSNDINRDSIISKNWDEVANWIKQHFAA
jgi:hypothetical protein